MEAQIVTETLKYPLGGVWRSTVQEGYEKYHIEMAQEEIKAIEAEDNQKLVSDTTNIALFRLIGHSIDLQETDLIPEMKGKPFFSRGNIFIKENFEETFPITDRKNKAQQEITKYRTQFQSIDNLLKEKTKSISAKFKPLIGKIGSEDFEEKVHASIKDLEGEIIGDNHNYKRFKNEFDEISKYEKIYEDQYILKCEQDRINNELGVEKQKQDKDNNLIDSYQKELDFYNECKNSLYDSEQVILRVLDNFFENNEKINNLKQKNLDQIILHVHSRLDMCPYCLKSFHLKTKVWNKILTNHEINAKILCLVSSRQDYIPKFACLSQFQSYKGRSMRFLGRDDHSLEQLNEIDIKKFSNESIVVQHVINPFKLQ